MDELTGNQSQLTGADDFSLQSNLSDRLQTRAESGSSETLESNIIAQSLDFKDWMAEVQQGSTSKAGLTARQTALFQRSPNHAAPWSKLSKQLHAVVSGQSMVEISEIDIMTGDSSIFWGGHLDNPREGDRIYGSTTTISGWVIGKQAKAITLRVTFQQKTIAETLINVERPDVKKVYSFSPDAHRSGFCLNLDFQVLPSVGKLEIKAVLSDQTIQSISDFKFTKYAALFQ